MHLRSTCLGTLLGLNVIFACLHSRAGWSKEHEALSFAFAGRGQPAHRNFLQRPASTAGTPALKEFVNPARRFPGHAVLAVFRAFMHLLMIFGTGAVIVPVMALLLPVVRRRDPTKMELLDKCIIAWSRIVVFPFFKVRVTGLENLPPPGKGVVYVANHQSFMDIFSSYHLQRCFKFVSKASILKIPVVGAAMKLNKTITIEREDRRSQMATFRHCVDVLKKDVSIFVFPEGTRSSDGSLLEFKKGPFSMAKRAGVPIQPITIRGTGRLMPNKKEFFLFCSRAGVEMVVHPTVPAEEVQETPDAELMEKVKGTIESALPAELQKSSA